jgi:hypothetical protein
MVYDIIDRLQAIYPLKPLNLEEIQYIVIHHAEASSATWQDINKWHKEFGWSCGGYNEYIRCNGDVYIMRGDNEGAHTKGYNGIAYGICCEGNYKTLNEMPRVQFQVLVERVNFQKNRLPHKNIKIVPHSLLVETECPGQYFPLAKMLEKVDERQRENNDDDGFDGIVDVLASYTTSEGKPLLDAEYWKRFAERGKMVKGEYARTLIMRLFEKIPM